MEQQQQPTSAAAGGGGTTGGGINREQMKKMSEADKEIELRANRAKALLAERLREIDHRVPEDASVPARRIRRMKLPEHPHEFTASRSICYFQL